MSNSNLGLLKRQAVVDVGLRIRTKSLADALGFSSFGVHDRNDPVIKEAERVLKDARRVVTEPLYRYFVRRIEGAKSLTELRGIMAVVTSNPGTHWNQGDSRARTIQWAARKIGRVAKDAVANPYTGLGRARLMTEFRQLSANTYRRRT